MHLPQWAARHTLQWGWGECFGVWSNFRRRSRCVKPLKVAHSLRLYKTSGPRVTDSPPPSWELVGTFSSITIVWVQVWGRVWYSLSLSGCSGPLAYCVNTHTLRERAVRGVSVVLFRTVVILCQSRALQQCVSRFGVVVISTQNAFEKGDAPATLSLAEDGQGWRWLLSSLHWGVWVNIAVTVSKISRTVRHTGSSIRPQERVLLSGASRSPGGLGVSVGKLAASYRPKVSKATWCVPKILRYYSLHCISDGLSNLPGWARH